MDFKKVVTINNLGNIDFRASLLQSLRPYVEDQNFLQKGAIFILIIFNLLVK